MGTPGDKSSLEKIADSNSGLNPEATEKQHPLTPSIIDPITSSSLIETSEMGMIGNLSELHSFTTGQDCGPLSKPEVFQPTLTQSVIEDFFSQSKYYLEGTGYSQNVGLTSTFQSHEQPGPSGLQSTPKLAGKKKKKQEKSMTKKTHTCPVCHKTFMTSEKFNKHYQSHTGSSQFKCEHCKKTFSSKFKLVRHALIHSDQKPFSCRVCEKTFHRKDHLKNHVKVHSPTKTLYECERAECNKQYTSQLSYRKHLAIHAAEDGNLTCQICFSVFQTKDEILYHLKVHAGSRTVKSPNEKKYLCEYCDRRFFTKKDVRRHLVVHTGMRNFLCQFCPQRFGRKDHLVRHIKKSHNQQYSEEPVIAPAQSAERIKQETVVRESKTDVNLSQPILVDDLYASTTGPTLQLGTSSALNENVQSDSRQIKIEPESSLVDPQNYKMEDLDLEDVKTIFEQQNLSSLSEGEMFLSSQTDLPELCSEIPAGSPGGTLLLEQPQEQCAPVLATEEQIIDPQVLNILQSSSSDTLPLPGFKQTFQPPPPH